MTSETENNSKLKEIVYGMIHSGAPERKVELDRIWEEHFPEFLYSEDKPGFILEAGAFGSLRLTDRTLRLICLFGHISWRALSLYGGFIHLYSVSRSELNFKEAESDEESKHLIDQHGYLLSCFHRLKEAESRMDHTWPEMIPLPVPTRPVHSDEEAAVYDLMGVAMVFMFLHELKHIQISNSNEPVSYHEEELDCDNYARSFLLKNIENYSSMSGDDYFKVMSKRAMGIALAYFLILELTPQERWDGSDTHPSVYSRLIYLMGYPELDIDDNYWLYLGSLIITKLRMMGVSVPKLHFGSRKEFCSKMFKIL